MLNNKKYELLPEVTAFDYEILQKILPRIQGSSVTIKNMLIKLFQYCAGILQGFLVLIHMNKCIITLAIMNANTVKAHIKLLL